MHDASAARFSIENALKPGRAAATVLLLLVVLLAAAMYGQQRADPRFDWFEYEGSDSIYQHVRASAAEYLNPILPGFYPDPSITRVGSDYYLVTSSFAYYPGVPIFHSNDLVHWKQIGHVLNRPSQLDLDSAGISRGIFAPALSYHDGTYYLITTLVDRGGNFFVTARNPAGPWSDPVWLDFDGIDPSFFFDDDGRAYVVNNGPPGEQPRYDGHRALWIQEFDIHARKLIGPRSVIVNGGVDITKNPIWIEGPHIFKVKGTYYLIAAEGGTAEGHSEVVFRSQSVRGPWEPYAGNPILTQRHLDSARAFPVTSTGHADFVETQNGEWWAVFLGTRPYFANHYNTGRETFLLPVHWREGWPVILSGGETVPYTQHKPNLSQHTTPEDMKSGNFVERDDFNARELKPYWQMIRTPRERGYDLTAMPGWLTLRARPVALGSRGQPSFLGRRQQHARASATTALVYWPARTGERAGLVAFQDDNFFYCLCVTVADGARVLQLLKRASARPEGEVQIIASARLDPARSQQTLYLRIEARDAAYSFHYGYDRGKLMLLKDNQDGTILSTKVAGGFVGTMFGLHAEQNGAN
jgi:alpha-N-arabinofuranosidase